MTQDNARDPAASLGSADESAAAIEAAFDGGGCAARKVAKCIERLEKEVASLRLTDAEREAVETCILGLVHPEDSTDAATLRGLLDRTDTGGK